MPKPIKRKYEKPVIKKIRLDAKTAVLGFCKISSIIGPSGPNCGAPGPPCSAPGS